MAKEIGGMSCPHCFNELEEIQVDWRYVKHVCPDCGYEKEMSADDMTVGGWMYLYYPIMAWGNIL